MTNHPLRALASIAIVIVPLPALAQDTSAWIEESNAYTIQLLEMEAQFFPESASQTGLGLTDVATAERALTEEARFSPSMVKQEVDRYTFRAPGQAGSYFYGYNQLIDLRTETELVFGDEFDRMALNDFIGAQPAN